MVGNGAIDLYWGRCGRVYRCISLLRTYWWSSSLKMFTWDGVIGNIAVDLHWGRCGRELNDIIYGVVGYVSVVLFLGRCGRYGSIYLYRGRCGRLWCCKSLLGTLW